MHMWMPPYRSPSSARCACGCAHHPQTCCSAPCSLVLARVARARSCSLAARVLARGRLRGQVGVVASARPGGFKQ
jgi:hypothetical protein